jgi:hypothetical protein
MGRRRQWGSVRRLASGRYQARLPDGSLTPDTFRPEQRPAGGCRWPRPMWCGARSCIPRSTPRSPSPSGSRNGAHRTRCTSDPPPWLVTCRQSAATSFRSSVTSSSPSRGGPTSRASWPTCTARSGSAPRDRSTGCCEPRSTPRSTPSCGPAPPPGASSWPQTPKTDVVTFRPKSSTPWRRRCRTAGGLWCPSPVPAVCAFRGRGLRVGPVDLAHHRLQVIETVPQVGGDRAEPKTAAGRHTVPLPGLIAQVLDGHLRRHRLTGEVGPLLDRCHNPEQVAAICGAAPITRASGRTRTVGFRYAANKPARVAITGFADCSRHSSVWAAHRYNQARARGARHPHAVRIVARGWLRIIWACWHTNTAYEPTRHRGEQLATHPTRPRELKRYLARELHNDIQAIATTSDPRSQIAA